MIILKDPKGQAFSIERRKQFNFLYDNDAACKALAAHRAAGKTWAVIDYAMFRLLEGAPADYAVFLSKTLKQAKSTIGPALIRWRAGLTKVLEYNKSDLVFKINLSKYDSRELFLFSYENADTKRGFHPETVICDETGEMPDGMFGEVISPMINTKSGRLIVTGTPKGPNQFYKLILKGESPDCPDWASLRIRASESRILQDDVIYRLKQNMTPAEYAQEMECDFHANVVVGSVYGDIMDRFTLKNISDTYDYNPVLPVYTAWDFGHAHFTSIWFFQIKDDRVTFIDFFEDSQRGLSYYANEVLCKPYTYKRHFVPHDAEHGNIRSEQTIRQQLTSLGLKGIETIERSSITSGVECSRMQLKTARFNATNCNPGLIHLKSYKYKYNPAYGVDRQKPLKDEHEDAADAFRYACQAIQNIKKVDEYGIIKQHNSKGGYNPLHMNF